MKKLIATVLIVSVLWFGLKNWTYRTWLSQGTPIETLAPDYSLAGSWAVLPDQPAPAVWTDGWASDVFYLPPPSTAPQYSGTVSMESSSANRDIRKGMENLMPALRQAGHVYAPFYRYNSPASNGPQLTQESLEDRSAAFEQYLTTFNRGRAFFVATNIALDPLIQARINQDPALNERFGGVITLTEVANGALVPATFGGQACSAAFEPSDCVHPLRITHKRNPIGFLAPQLPVRRTTLRLAEDETGSVLLGKTKHMLAWLEENGAKLAEPLGGFDDFEEIEIAPIREPGQVDELPPSESEEPMPQD